MTDRRTSLHTEWSRVFGAPVICTYPELYGIKCDGCGRAGHVSYDEEGTRLQWD
jgi:hypothetical protein